MSGPLRGPTEGIVASARAHGWAATRWIALFDALKKSHHSQLARGRALARGGKVRELWFSPSLVGAYVADGRDEFHVRMQFKPFEKAGWDLVVARLLERLARIADLLEGELSEDFAALLDADGASLIPRRKEIEGTCDCGDYKLPCAHMAAVHHVLADALDGDPFLLITLRGLDRDQLIDRLRAGWGDPTPLIAHAPDAESPPPAAEARWLDSPEPLPPVRVRLPETPEPLAGIAALGPPPGGAEVEDAVRPLYAAGAEAAGEVAFANAKPSNREATQRWEGFLAERAPPPVLAAKLDARQTIDIPAAEAARISKIVEHLAAFGATAAGALADRIAEPRAAVQRQLEALKLMGVVYRTGQARSLRWRLG